MASDDGSDRLLQKQFRVGQGKCQKECQVVVTTDYLSWSSGETSDKVDVRLSWVLKTDLAECTSGEGDTEQSSLTVHYVVRTDLPDYSSNLSLNTVVFSGPKVACAELAQAIQAEIPKKVPNRPKSLLIIVNPKSGNGKGERVYTDKVAPLFKLCGIKTDVQVTQRAKHSDEILDKYDLSQVDGVIAVGGDGTLTEVVSALLKRTMKDAGVDENDPDFRPKTPSPICSLIPAGSGNGHPLFAGFSKDAKSTALMIAIGHSQLMDVNTIHCGKKFIAYVLLLLGYGQFARIMGMMEDNRWAGPARYLALPFCLFLSRKMIDVEVDYLPAKPSEPKSDSTGNPDTDPAQDKAPDANSGNTSSVWKTFRGNFMGIDSVTINPFVPQTNKPFFEQLTLNDGKLRLFATKQCGRLQQIKFFDKLKKNDHTAFAVDFIDCFEVNAYRIRASGAYAESQSARAMNWDGDIIRSPEPHLEIRAHQSVLKIFTRDDGEELRQPYLNPSGTPV